MDEDDMALLDAWAHGDEARGAVLVERHFDSVFRFFGSRVRSDADVTDLAQRTFLACLENRGRWDGVRRFRPYLLGIARNQLLMHLRHQRIHAREEAVGSLQERLVQTGLRVSQVAAERESRRALLVALRSLPDSLQMVLELHYWEGLSTREVGEVLEISREAVKARLFKARKRLAEALERLQGTTEVADATLRGLGDWVASLRLRLPNR